jgi:ribonuclease D
MRHSSTSSSQAPHMAYTLISDVASLERSIALWTQDTASDRRIAIDTEFIRERTYAPVLEMVQVASPNGHIGLIDVPAIGDLTLLWQFLDDPTLTKLVHAGNQDVEIMALAFGRPLNGPWFDTQVAGAFLGIGLQAGYGAIVQQVLHVKLDKEEGFSDWSRRPFTDSMLNYAAGDVHYLHALETWLSERLAKRGRTQWAIDQTNRILGHSADQTAPEDLWQRVGGKH